ncbi:hypothetical protein AwEntero_29420 [Enterobacterales bacterium]|nr:hypothetical protein AwEntero_29420 [Enterobacterales bacterium]
MGSLLVNDQGRQHDDASRVITGGDLTTLTFELTSTGAWAIEDIVYYFMAAIVIALLGCGRYSVMKNTLYR